MPHQHWGLLTPNHVLAHSVHIRLINIMSHHNRLFVVLSHDHRLLNYLPHYVMAVFLVMRLLMHNLGVLHLLQSVLRNHGNRLQDE